MKTIDLVATRSQTYGSKRLKAGDSFQARREDAKVLLAIKHARHAPAKPAAEKPNPAAKKAQTYMTREMRAEPVADPAMPAPAPAPEQGAPVGGMGTQSALSRAPRAAPKQTKSDGE